MSTETTERIPYLSNQLIGLFKRLDPDLSPDAENAILYLIQATQSGHVCVFIYDKSQQKALKSSPLVASVGNYAPLVLDNKNRLYFARHWWHESQLAKNLLAKTERQPIASDTDIAHALNQLFDVTSDGEMDRQRLAAALAMLQPFLIISGGPGTGKTTTVVKLLAMLAKLSPKPLIMQMAAPTGKAAARLSESMRNAFKMLESRAPEVISRLPQEAKTLHRLLGLIPGNDKPTYHAGNPIPLDVLVIDEASMIDLVMMSQVLDALPAHARLIVLGDKDQLASVDAGRVLGDLAENEVFSTQTLDVLQSCGFDAQALTQSENTWRDTVVFLTRSHRFDANSGIGQLAKAVNMGDVDEAKAILEKTNFADVCYQKDLPDSRMLYQKRQSYFEKVATADPHAVFADYQSWMVLATERAEVDRVNRAIEEMLEANQQKTPDSIWYEGRAIMVTQNDYGVNLFNGDIGIALKTPQGLRVFFQQANGQFRQIAPSRLPEHQTAFAMTVHKSQGSEFNNVWFYLPSSDSPLLTRSLFYTAITRAKQFFAVMGNLTILETAIVNQPQRHSGLKDYLKQANPM